jgi:hypothetical protein
MTLGNNGDFRKEKYHLLWGSWRAEERARWGKMVHDIQKEGGSNRFL